MAVPQIIRIGYEPDYRTRTIGRYTDGQFFASITYAFPEGFSHGEGWEDQKKLFVVLHRFDMDGHHLDSDVWCAGTWREQKEQSRTTDSVLARAKARMTELLDGLPGREYADIAIRPFYLTVDNVFFGLVVERHGENEDDWVELYPDRLGFSAPWDGTYDT